VVHFPRKLEYFSSFLSLTFLPIVLARFPETATGTGSLKNGRLKTQRGAIVVQMFLTALFLLQTP
jgi:hypothetical protein